VQGGRKLVGQACNWDADDADDDDDDDEDEDEDEDDDDDDDGSCGDDDDKDEDQHQSIDPRCRPLRVVRDEADADEMMMTQSTPGFEPLEPPSTPKKLILSITTPF